MKDVLWEVFWRKIIVAHLAVYENKYFYGEKKKRKERN